MSEHWKYPNSWKHSRRQFDAVADSYLDGNSVEIAAIDGDMSRGSAENFLHMNRLMRQNAITIRMGRKNRVEEARRLAAKHSVPEIAEIMERSTHTVLRYLSEAS